VCGGHYSFPIFFSLVIAGALATENQQHFTVVLMLGAIICWLVALTIFRSQQKFDIIFDLLPGYHPAKRVDDIANRRYGVRRIIGYVIPFLCSTVLTVGAILAYNGILCC